MIAAVGFFAMNMGASGIAPSFAPVYGSKLVGKKNALFLFGIFVMLGAVLMGRNVTSTLGKGLLPPHVIDFDIVLVILTAATSSLFLANLLKIPQSTSQVTVGAFAGVGLYFSQLNLETLLLKIFPCWVILPSLSYILTLLVYRKIYPPDHDNLHIYQRLFANEKKLKLSALIVSCYVAFAIGSNNVANAVGPLFGAGIVRILPGLLLVSPFFQLGAWLMGRGPLETAGREVIPLGLFSSTLVSFVTATLLLVASFLGIPQSLVQLNLASIFAISCLKDGHRCTWDRTIVQKTFIVWFITPVLSLLISYALVFLLRR